MQRKKASQTEKPTLVPTTKKNTFPSHGPVKQDHNDRNPDSSFEMRITNPEHHSAEQQTLQKLLDMNESYLREKIKVSDVPRPSKFAYKMPSKTGSSEYNRKYTSLSRVAVEGSTPQRDKTGSIMRLPNHHIIEYASVYNNDYKEQAVQKTPHKVQKKHEKSEAPTFIETSYHRDYRSLAASPAISAKRAEVRLMGGGKLSSDTTYNQYYRAKTIESVEAPRPIIHKDNKIFIAMTHPPQTIYRQNFSKQTNKQPLEPSCKPHHQYTPATHKLKYKTEYNEEFVGQSIAKRSEFQCLSREELKQYVMTILQE